MFEVIRSAITIFKTAIRPEQGIVHRLGQSTPPVQDLTAPVSALNQATISRLGVRGRRLAQRFLICKHRGGTHSTNAAEINEAMRRIGWNATLIAANLAAYCEVAGCPQVWGRGVDQGQLARRQMSSGWEDKAGESAGRIKEEMKELERAVRGLAERYQTVVD